MKDIEKMMKCRSIFLYNIGLIYEDFNVLNDERLYILLEGFLDDYVNSYPSIFNLMYYFKTDENDNLYVYEEEEWNDILTKYLKYFAYHDYKNITKMYDDVGYNNVNSINKLVDLFFNYIMGINDLNKARIRS